MRQIRPRRKLYHSNAINDIICNVDQFDYIQHVHSMGKSNHYLHLFLVSDSETSQTATHERSEMMEMEKPIPQIYDSIVCPELCYIRRIPTQPMIDRFEKTCQKESLRVVNFMAEQATLVKNKSSFPRNECQYHLNFNLQNDHLLRCSESIETIDVDQLLSDISKSTVSFLSKLPQMLDSSQPLLSIREPSQLQFHSCYTSEFSIVFNSIPRRQHTSNKHCVEHSYGVEKKTGNCNIINMSKSFFRRVEGGGHSSPIKTKTPSRKTQRWLEKKKEKWRDHSYLCKSMHIVESQRCFYYLRIIMPDNLNSYQLLPPTSFRTVPSFHPRRYFIYIDDKMDERNQVKSITDLDAYSIASSIDTGQSHVIQCIKPLPISSHQRPDERSKIVVKKSTRSFSNFWQKQDNGDKEQGVTQIIEEIPEEQPTSYSYIVEDSINRGSSNMVMKVEDIKEYLFSESSSTPLIQIQRKRRLPKKRMPIVQSSRSVQCYRTIGSIMSSYKLNGGVFIPHVTDEKKAFSETTLSSVNGCGVKHLLRSNKVPSLVSAKRNRKSHLKPGKTLSTSNLEDGHFQLRRSKSKTTIQEYSHHCVHILPSMQGKDASNEVYLPMLFDRFEVIQSMSVAVRGELLHLRTKSSDLERIEKDGSSFCRKPQQEQKIKDEKLEKINDRKRQTKTLKDDSQAERRKKRKMKRKHKEKKRTSAKKRKRKDHVKEKSVDVIEVPSLKVGTTPMIITHAKYEVTSFQNEQKGCCQQTFRGDLQVQMSTDREVPRVAIPSIPINKTPVIFPNKEGNNEVKIHTVPYSTSHNQNRVPLMTPAKHTSLEQICAPLETSTIMQKLSNRNISSKSNYDHMNTTKEMYSNSFHAIEEQKTLHSFPGMMESQQQSRNSTQEGVNREQLNLFCSEQFIETWSQAAAELSSGQWAHHILKNDESTLSTIPLSRYQIQLHDCVLLDDCEVDVEFPDRTAIKVISLAGKNLTHTSFAMSPRSYIKALVSLASRGRYKTIHLVFVFHSLHNYQYSSEIANLQNAIVKQRGCPCDYLRLQYTQSDLLSSVIATISSKYLQTNILKNIDIETRIVESARFLLSMIPTLTAFDCINLLRNQNVTLKDQIVSISNLRVNSVKKDTTQQVKAAMIASLENF